MTEQWKNVVGFPGYQVSNLGNVRSCWVRCRNSRLGDKWHNMKATIDKKHTGYRKLSLTRDGRPHYRTVASLVCEAFHGPRPPNGQVCHNDGIRTNDNSDNLRWGTQSENEHDKIAHGTSWKTGSRKLSPDQVLSIRRLYATGNYTQKQLAADFGIHQTHVSDIVNRKRWDVLRGDK